MHKAVFEMAGHNTKSTEQYYINININIFS